MKQLGIKFHKTILLIAGLSFLLINTGCSEQFYRGFVQGLANTSNRVSSGGSLMIFGGSGHKDFLGCLNCSEYSNDSIFNEYGTYGSSYSSNSIHNSYSEYGSPYSRYSACNSYASDPPVVVDEHGNYYGRLTINSYNIDQLKDDNLINWLKTVCEN